MTYIVQSVSLCINIIFIPHNEYIFTFVMMKPFWKQIVDEIQDIDPDSEDFKSQAFPTSRVKKLINEEIEINGYEDKVEVKGFVVIWLPFK